MTNVLKGGLYLCTILSILLLLSLCMYNDPPSSQYNMSIVNPIATSEARSNNVSKTVQELGPVSVGKPFPTFGIDTLDGEYLSLSQLLEQEKYVVFSYFATWCKPCRFGLPIMDKVANENENVIAVYVALGEHPPAKLKKFVRKLELDGVILLDPHGKFAEFHGVAGKGQGAVIPRTFVLDPNGIVTQIFVEEGDDFEQLLTVSIQ